MKRTPEELERISRETLAKAGGLYTLEDIFQQIADGKMQSFAHGDTWVVTAVHDFPQKRAVDFTLVVGDYLSCLEIQKQVLEFAEMIGADMLMGSGREGWDKYKTEGWRKLSVNYLKEL